MLPVSIRHFINRSAYIAAGNWLAAGEGRRTSMIITGLSDVSLHLGSLSNSNFVSRIMRFYICSLANPSTETCNATTLLA
jgi:hypothetical protein